MEVHTYGSELEIEIIGDQRRLVLVPGAAYHVPCNTVELDAAAHSLVVAWIWSARIVQADRAID